MNKQVPLERLPVEQVPGYQAEVNRRSLEYVNQNWLAIEMDSIEDQQRNRAEFNARLKADLEAEYEAGRHLSWGK